MTDVLKITKLFRWVLNNQSDFVCAIEREIKRNWNAQNQYLYLCVRHSPYAIPNWIIYCRRNVSSARWKKQSAHWKLEIGNHESNPICANGNIVPLWCFQWHRTSNAQYFQWNFNQIQMGWIEAINIFFLFFVSTTCEQTNKQKINYCKQLNWFNAAWQRYRMECTLPSHVCNSRKYENRLGVECHGFVIFALAGLAQWQIRQMVFRNSCHFINKCTNERGQFLFHLFFHPLCPLWLTFAPSQSDWRSPSEKKKKTNETKSNYYG